MSQDLKKKTCDGFSYIINLNVKYFTFFCVPNQRNFDFLYFHRFKTEYLNLIRIFTDIRFACTRRLMWGGV